MLDLAIDGVLPFRAVVQVREDGYWAPVAEGSSVAWLSQVAAEEAEIHGESRVTSPFGRVIHTAKKTPVSTVGTLTVGEVKRLKTLTANLRKAQRTGQFVTETKIEREIASIRAAAGVPA